MLCPVSNLIYDDIWPDSLLFRYRYGYLPASLIPRLIVSTKKRQIKNTFGWRTGGVFAVNDCKILVEAHINKSRQKIDIAVAGPIENRPKALKAIQVCLEEVHQKYPESEPVQHVPLPDKRDADFEYLILLSLLKDNGPKFVWQNYQIGQLLEGLVDEIPVGGSVDVKDTAEVWFNQYKSYRRSQRVPGLDWFVPLKVARLETDENIPHKEYDNLFDLVVEVNQPVLLLGDPGGGKTTLLADLEEHLFKVGERDIGVAPIPIRFDLNTYSQLTSSGVFDSGVDTWLQLQKWLSKIWQDDVVGADNDAPSLEELLRTERVWLLFDALNEMLYEGAQDRFVDLAEIINRISGRNRVVVSCRTQELLGEWHHAKAKVQPMALEDMRSYLKKACVTRKLPESVVRNLQQYLEEEGTLKLYENPYRLSLLAQVVDEDGVIPINRAKLFDYSIRQRMKREAQKKTWHRINKILSTADRRSLYRHEKTPSPSSRNQGPLLRALGELAYKIQSTDNRGILEQTNVESLFLSLKLSEDEIESILRAAETLDILRSQLVQGELCWRFVHEQYQQYFAARAWLAKESRSFEYLIKEKFEGTSKDRRIWRETAVIAMQLQGPDDNFARELTQISPSDAARWVLNKNNEFPDANLKKLLRAKLGSLMSDRSGSLSSRIEAGLALDSPEYLSGFQTFGIGDTSSNQRFYVPPLITVPAGVYVVGENGRQITVDRPICVSKYPVTRAEFECFFGADGYGIKRYWGETESWAWRSGQRVYEAPRRGAEIIRGWSEEELAIRNTNVATALVRQREKLRKLSEREAYIYWESLNRIRELRSWSESFFGELKKDLQWMLSDVLILSKIRSCLTDDEAVEIISKHPNLVEMLHPGRIGRPRRWEQERFRGALQPIIGVSFFEAQAYISWLNHVSGRKFRLPSEVEWEAAARGQRIESFVGKLSRLLGVQDNSQGEFIGRRWAFGSKFSESRCNTFEGGQGRTTPIGVYVDGATPSGLHDLSGNVWEWTSTRSGERGYILAKGGCWFRPKEDAQTIAYRSFSPDLQDEYCGFRICCEL